MPSELERLATLETQMRDVITDLQALAAEVSTGTTGRPSLRRRVHTLESDMHGRRLLREAATERFTRREKLAGLALAAWLAFVPVFDLYLRLRGR